MWQVFALCPRCPNALNPFRCGSAFVCYYVHHFNIRVLRSSRQHIFVTIACYVCQDLSNAQAQAFLLEILNSRITVLAEISLRSPGKLLIFTIKKIIYSIKISNK